MCFGKFFLRLFFLCLICFGIVEVLFFFLISLVSIVESVLNEMLVIISVVMSLFNNWVNVGFFNGNMNFMNINGIIVM